VVILAVFVGVVLVSRASPSDLEFPLEESSIVINAKFILSSSLYSSL
jgi:hypothetical protein